MFRLEARWATLFLVILYSTSDDRFISGLGTMLADFTGEQRSESFLFQILNIAVQRGNVISIMGTLSRGEKVDELSNVLKM